MKVIFLDVDGVLNCDTTQETINGWAFVDDDKIQLIRHIIVQTGAVVVLDSTWRQGYYGITIKNEGDLSDWGVVEYKALKERCEKYGVEFWGYTGWPLSYDRGKLIKQWMDEYHENYEDGDPITSFVIIDDEDLMISEKFPDNFVKTRMSRGITKRDAEHAIQILGRER